MPPLKGTRPRRCARTSSWIMEVLLCTKTYSMARVGISAMRMRRKALATAASMPIREKEASKGSLWWNWTWKFSWNLFLSQEKSSWKISESALLHVEGVIETSHETQSTFASNISSQVRL